MKDKLEEYLTIILEQVPKLTKKKRNENDFY